jgi:hypothetical protein
LEFIQHFCSFLDPCFKDLDLLTEGELAMLHNHILEVMVDHMSGNSQNAQILGMQPTRQQHVQAVAGPTSSWNVALQIQARLAATTRKIKATLKQLQTWSKSWNSCREEQDFYIKLDALVAVHEELDGNRGITGATFDKPLEWWKGNKKNFQHLQPWPRRIMQSRQHQLQLSECSVWQQAD